LIPFGSFNVNSLAQINPNSDSGNYILDQERRDAGNASLIAVQQLRSDNRQALFRR
jgi:hypothetical protein